MGYRLRVMLKRVGVGDHRRKEGGGGTMGRRECFPFKFCLFQSIFFHGTFHYKFQTQHTCTYSCIGTSRKKIVPNPHERVIFSVQSFAKS